MELGPSGVGLDPSLRLRPTARGRAPPIEASWFMRVPGTPVVGPTTPSDARNQTSAQRIAMPKSRAALPATIFCMSSLGTTA